MEVYEIRRLECKPLLSAAEARVGWALKSGSWGTHADQGSAPPVTVRFG